MYHEAFETDSDMQKWESGCWIRYKMFERAIKNTTTIDPVKHGRWDKDSIAFYWRCSECGAIVKSNLWDVFLDPFSSHRNLNYCPNCGAQMEEVTE